MRDLRPLRIHFMCGTILATVGFPSKRLRHDRRTEAIDFLKIPEAVASTKGSSTGGVAGDGPMAVAGRAPMLPVDYSFFGSKIGLRQQVELRGDPV